MGEDTTIDFVDLQRRTLQKMRKVDMILRALPGLDQTLWPDDEQWRFCIAYTRTQLDRKRLLFQCALPMI